MTRLVATTTYCLVHMSSRIEYLTAFGGEIHFLMGLLYCRRAIVYHQSYLSASSGLHPRIA